MSSLQTRVMNILKNPATEWPVIAAESTDVGRLYREYIVPLAAIPAVAGFIGRVLIHVPFMWGLSSLLVSYVMTLVGAYIAAVVIEWLAPRFQSSGSRVDALKLVAYASTPMWVAGVLNVIPTLGLLAVLASLYGIYLFYLGLPVLFKTPADKVVIYMIVCAVVMVVVSMVIGSVSAALAFGGRGFTPLV